MSEESKPAMGHGVKQRDLIKMTQAEIDDFLAQRLSATMSTLNADGSIHSVAMWYGFLGGAVAVETKGKGQKVVNLRRNPNVTMLMETGDYYEELKGVSIVGKGEIIDDPDQLFELGKSVFSRYVMPYTDDLKAAVDAMMRNRVVIKVNTDKVVSWDHGKLGLPSTRPPA